jgi:hypothetical protein
MAWLEVQFRSPWHCTHARWPETSSGLDLQNGWGEKDPDHRDVAIHAHEVSKQNQTSALQSDACAVSVVSASLAQAGGRYFCTHARNTAIASPGTRPRFRMSQVRLAADLRMCVLQCRDGPTRLQMGEVKWRDFETPAPITHQSEAHARGCRM